MPFDLPAQAFPDTLSFASHPGILTRLMDELGGADRIGDAASRLLLQDPALALMAVQALSRARPGVALADQEFRTGMAGLEPASLKSRIIAAASAQLATPGPSATDLDTVWRKALACAHFARALAVRSGYPGADEAWLAGLSCWLPGFARNADWQDASLRGLAQAALDQVPLNSFLADALRHLDEPVERLRDATPLVRIAVAAHRQTRNYPAWIPALPHPDTLALAAPLGPDDIGRILLGLGPAIDALAGAAGLPQAHELARALSCMNRLERAAAQPPLAPAAAAARLADDLAGQDDLGQALYLRRVPETGALASASLDGRPVPALAIDPEGSATAAARALLSGKPVVVTLEPPADAALLDRQLIRRARSEGLAALPIGADAPGGVLLVFGTRQALAGVAAQPRLYGRLGHLAGRAPPLGTPEPAGDPLADRVQQALQEISNPLGIVKNYLTLARAKLGNASAVDDELGIVQEELDRIVRILRGLDESEGAAAIPEQDAEAARPTSAAISGYDGK